MTEKTLYCDHCERAVSPEHVRRNQIGQTLCPECYISSENDMRAIGRGIREYRRLCPRRPYGSY
jgi:hypothetical protein